ncbi:MAG: hypothetical protein WCD86_02560, partial [Ktedonobacteraceae bacterium]
AGRYLQLYLLIFIFRVDFHGAGLRQRERQDAVVHAGLGTKCNSSVRKYDSDAVKLFLLDEPG